MNSSMDIMWPKLETALTTTIHSASYVQITVIAAFFYWLLHARIRAMVDVMSAKLYEVCSSPYEGSSGNGVKQSSSSLHHQLTQYQLRKRENVMKSKNSAINSYENALFETKESIWNGVTQTERRPVVGLSCQSCTPTSRKNLPEQENLPIVNVLRLDDYKRSYSFLNGTFATIFHCLTFKHYNFPYIFGTVLEDSNVKESITAAAKVIASELGCTDERGLSLIIERQRKRAEKILSLMHSKLSNFVIRISSWVFYKTLPLLFKSVSIPEGQLHMLKKAAASGLPLIFLPLHKSHIDYIAVTFTLCNNNIRSPLVAAGENLRIPIFGRILQGLGAFYIKRRIDPVSGKKDKVYRAILQTYMTQCLQAGHYFEFFIEGGRTRTGKPCNPKGGLLSVFVDAYLNGLLEDALLVPVSVNYEKIVEGSFVREQTGDEKQPESFMTAIKGIYKALTSHYGIVRVDINQPFSLHELVRSFQGKIRTSGGSLHVVPSSASLYGTDIVIEEQRQLVDSIARHIIYDCSQSTAVMSTNALAFLLLNIHRKGVTLADLTYSLDKLRDELISTGKDMGFTGESKDVLEHAIELLGPGLIQREKTADGDVFIKPVTLLPNIIELAYYNNTLLPHFALEGIIGRTLLYLSANSPTEMISFDKIIDCSIYLCEILQFEFIFTKTCQSLNDAIFDTMDVFTLNEIVTSLQSTKSTSQSGARLPRSLDIIDDDEDEDFIPASPFYKVNRSEPKLKYYGALLRPILDTYFCVFSHLQMLIGKQVVEKELIKEILNIIRRQLSLGVLTCGESLSTETIKNCLKLLEKWHILDCINVSGTKLYYLNKNFNTEVSLESVVDRVERYRQGDVEN
ncbi:glycerol-3-phosphate acyltransferase 1, mitochondrial isoform X2 [Cimex lectularius]|nr:glycerol-3-phosphate acyltransferase 1, mitochondrial isoform X2 [Cimex lectularius]